MAAESGVAGDGNCMGLGIAIGIVLGTAIGIYTDDLSLWLPVGVALGANSSYA